jgi:DNA topoisomerase-6 subunit A
MHSILIREKICPQLMPEKKAEQQAFAGKGLDYVTDTYLPKRLGKMGVVGKLITHLPYRSFQF